MGHRVSTPRHHGSAHVATASFAIFMAVAASANIGEVSAGRPPSRPGCFVSPRSRSRSWAAEAASPSSTSLRAAAYSSLLVAASASVPPPDSRLGQRRSQSHPQQPPGTKHRSANRENGRRRADGRGGLTDLRYATYSAHYNGDSGGGELYSSNQEKERSSSLWKGFSPKASAVEQEKNGSDALAATTKESINGATPLSSATKSVNLERKRARMLRFMDRRLALLRPKRSGANNDNSNPTIDNARRAEYEERKAAWAAKYTSASALRASFGKNKNRLWGDFDPTATRRLYHSLLPRALLELRGLRDGLLSSQEEEKKGGNKIKGRKRKGHKRGRSSELAMTGGYTNGDANATAIKNSNDNSKDGSEDDDSSYLQQELKELAPLAYRARLAAKKYARERSRLPGRIGSMLYDGYRSWRRYGKWTTSGMTWEQVWNKYEDQVLRERAMEGLDQGEIEGLDVGGGADLDDEELTARVCLRILERSVVTNKAIDRLFLERLAEKNEDDASIDGEEEDVTMEESQRRKQRQQRRRRRRMRHKIRMQADLAAIEKEFDDDIQELLRYSNLTTKQGEERRSKRARAAALWKRLGGSGAEAGTEGDDANAMPGVEKTAAAAAFARGGDEDERVGAAEGLFIGDMTELDEDGVQPSSPPRSMRRLAVHEVFALRIMATTKQRIELLQSLPQLMGGDGEDSDTDGEG